MKVTPAIVPTDGNKFGQRMLEKMGWTQGKGLGANENGRTHNVTAVFKARDDVRGMYGRCQASLFFCISGSDSSQNQ